MDQLSGGRFVMGLSSGDRPIDFASINHVVIAPQKEATRPALEVLQEIAEEVLPHFPAHE